MALDKQILQQLILRYTATEVRGVRVDPSVVYGVCVKESRLEPAACRYEPHYKWLFQPDSVKPAICSEATEIIMQKISWGLMQVMGAVYRELGYRGWLSEITADVDAQLMYGCLHLADKIGRHGLRGGLSAYNAGSPTDKNRGYVDDVLRFAGEWGEIAVPS